MTENWKVVNGYPLYEVSDLGRVRRISTGKVLKQSNNIDGYKVVTLYNNKVPKQFRVHRLVAMAFIPNPEDKPVVNHLDEVVYNNEVSNLEWATVKENTNHGNCLEKRAKAFGKPVIGVNIKDGSILKFPSASEAGRNGFSQAHVSSVCNGKETQHKGYMWKYLEEATE